MIERQDEWERRFREMAQAELSDRVKQLVLQRAQAHTVAGQRRGRRSRRGVWRSALAGVAGVAVAAVLAIVAWNLGSGTGLRLANTLPHLKVANATPAAIPQPGRYGLQSASLSVTGRKVIQHVPGVNGPVIQFTVQNIGKTPVGPHDVIGILGFSTNPGQDLLANNDWIGFVNGPSTTLQPSDTYTWTFHPIGVPTDKNGNWLGTPYLMFFNTKLVSPSQADKTVTVMPGVDLMDVHTVPRMQFTGGQSFEVRATLVNRTDHAIPLSDLLTMVWFSPEPDGGLTDPNTIRFFDNVTSMDKSTLSVAPGASLPIVLPPLIGPATPNFVQWDVHVAVIQHQW